MVIKSYAKDVDKMNKNILPKFLRKSFNCPYCGVYSHQEWRELKPKSTLEYSKADDAVCSRWNACDSMNNPILRPEKDIYVSWCEHCQKFSLWANAQLLIPAKSILPPPHSDTPLELAKLYVEAMQVYSISAKGAAAMIRLALHRLILQLGSKGNDLNDNIAVFLEQGLPAQVMLALRSIRVIGEKAVLPGVIYAEENTNETAALFDVFNLIVEYIITRKKELVLLEQKLMPQRDAAVEVKASFEELVKF